MLKLTVRELSEELGITKQAVFNHIKRNPEAFEGHVEKEGNQTYIDEVGQEYIRQKSYGRPQSQISDQTILQEVEQLRKENSSLKDKIIELQAEHFKAVESLVLARENQRLLEESRINVKQLMEANEKKDKEIDILEEYIRDSKENYKILQEEKESWIKTFKSDEEEIRALESRLEGAREKERQLEEELKKEKEKTWWDKLRGR